MTDLKHTLRDGLVRVPQHDKWMKDGADENGHAWIDPATQEISFTPVAPSIKR